MRPTIRVKRKQIKKVPVITGPTRIKVGYPAGDVDGEVISRAIWNHYGTSRGIPARPWLLNAMRANRAKYLEMLKYGASDIIQGRKTMQMVLRGLGVEARNDVRQSLIDLKDPPNAPATIRAKGSSNPLVETGRMHTSTTWKLDR